MSRRWARKSAQERIPRRRSSSQLRGYHRLSTSGKGRVGMRLERMIRRVPGSRTRAWKSERRRMRGAMKARQRWSSRRIAECEFVGPRRRISTRRPAMPPHGATRIAARTRLPRGTNLRPARRAMRGPSAAAPRRSRLPSCISGSSPGASGSVWSMEQSARSSSTRRYSSPPLRPT